MIDPKITELYPAIPAHYIAYTSQLEQCRKQLQRFQNLGFWGRLKYAITGDVPE